MYRLPSIDLPKAAIEEAQRQKTDPDTFYALSLLESTGIWRGFRHLHSAREREGTASVQPSDRRSTDDLERAVGLFRKHHIEFCKQYANCESPTPPTRRLISLPQMARTLKLPICCLFIKGSTGVAP
jgi:hypothetical protein